MDRRKGRAVVVGGSIAGLSCAHALIAAGWEVVVLEKTCAPPKGSPTGAGLGLDPQSQLFLHSWLASPDLLHTSTIPLEIDQNQVTDSEKKISWTLTRDESFNFRAAHWSELHSLLYKSLPSNVVLWGHQFLSFQTSHDRASVRAEAKVLQTDEVVEIVGNLLIAADGCLSAIRQHFLPHLKLRYSGYAAWRGVLDFSGNENSDTITGLRRVYPDLGKCLYFDLATGTHSVLYELQNQRINWIWYISQPELELKGNSVTMKVSNAMIQKMHEEAEMVWVPELAQVIKETKEPFINVIYDCDPLENLFWDNVVLIGDAAHPTSPHGVRSTNMSIVDAGTLGQCLERWGLNELGSALEEYQSIRLPVVSKQVLHSRRMGRIKQGLDLHDRKVFDPMMATLEECEELQQRKMPFFGYAPSPSD
ncbi:uncharacterized protein LOC131223273 [Magnolia sinica]|uniref:uncharacterized protein LOC131223273 n=1 Tax=Magnolia sinica TaxID=86752 RepID=UPI00265875B9|nr:uncharacterized protein LOC131223273 [Magnolia sinica]